MIALESPINKEQVNTNPINQIKNKVYIVNKSFVVTLYFTQNKCENIKKESKRIE